MSRGEDGPRQEGPPSVRIATDSEIRKGKSQGASQPAVWNMIRWPADEANATDGVKCCSRNAPRWAAIMTENGIGINAQVLALYWWWHHPTPLARGKYLNCENREEQELWMRTRVINLNKVAAGLEDCRHNPHIPRSAGGRRWIKIFPLRPINWINLKTYGIFHIYLLQPKEVRPLPRGQTSKRNVFWTQMSVLKLSVVQNLNNCTGYKIFKMFWDQNMKKWLKA